MLNYYPDFWAFYNENYKDVNTILYSIANKYQKIVEPDEMYNEIIVRLVESDFISRFNPTNLKASLQTFFYKNAWGYAMHFIYEICHQPKNINIDNYLQTTTEEKEAWNIRHNNNEYNPHIDFRTRPTFNETIDISLYSEEVMSILEKRLNETDYFIACLYFLDCFTCKEIFILTNKYTYNVILKKIYEIKAKTKRIIHSRSAINV